MKITIFGASLTRQDDPDYAEAYNLGKAMAELGHTVITGGYIGTMEAVSKGANEAGGKAVGVTCDQIENWRPVKPNQWLTDEIRCVTLLERILVLIEQAEIAVALPGGGGTLAEIALTWNQIQTQGMEPIPLILIGPGWTQTFDTMFQAFPDYILPHHQDTIIRVPDVNAAVEYIKEITQNQRHNE